MGGAHFVVDESRFNLTRRVAGGVSFNQAGGQSRLVAHDSLGMEGATTTFFAWSHDPAAMPGGPLLFAYRPYRAPSWDGMTHFQLLYDTSSSGFVELRLWERDTDGARLRDSVPIAGLVSHTLAVEVGAPSVGTSLTGSFRYALDEAPFRGAAALRDVPLAALPESREAIAVIGDGQFQTVHEVLVYDRALTDPEIAVVREYLRLRYRP